MTTPSSTSSPTTTEIHAEIHALASAFALKFDQSFFDTLLYGATLMPRTDNVVAASVYVHAETFKAYGILEDESQYDAAGNKIPLIWLPKSIVTPDKITRDPKGTNAAVMEMPEWLAHAKGLI